MNRKTFGRILRAESQARIDAEKAEILKRKGKKVLGVIKRKRVFGGVGERGGGGDYSAQVASVERLDLRLGFIILFHYA